MKRFVCAVLAAILTLAIIPMQDAAAAPDYSWVRVKLTTNNATTLSLYLSGDYFIQENGAAFSDGTLSVRMSGGSLTLIHSEAGQVYTGKSVKLMKKNISPSAGWIKLNNRNYLGHLALSAASSGYIQAVNHVPMAHYLYGVIGYEMSDSYPLEALKAQAVAAKCYAINKFRSSGDYDIGDTSSDQVYKGYNASYKNVIRAVDETISKALYVDGSVLNAYYAASNGGETNLPSYAWSSSMTNKGYAVTIDEYDFGNTGSPKETVTIPYGDNPNLSPEIKDMLLTKAGNTLGKRVTAVVNIRSVKLNTPRYAGTKRNLCKAVVSMTVAEPSSDGEGAYGATHDIDLMFTLTELLTYGVVDNASLRIYWGEETGSGYKIYHVRWGHGVGLSQRGAQARAKAGHSYSQILQFYYPGSTLGNITIKPPSNPTAPNPGPSASPNPTAAPTPTPELPSEPMGYGVVNANGVNFREGPGVEYPSVRMLNKGDELTLYALINGWYYAQTQNGDRYYIIKKFVDTTDKPGQGGDEDGRVQVSEAIITANGVNFRKGPGTSYESMGRLDKDTGLLIWDKIGDWYYAQIENVYGYVHDDYVKIIRTYYIDDPEDNPDTGDTGLGVTTGNVNFRTGPSTDYDRIKTLRTGTELTLYRIVDGWYEADAGGDRGYVSGKYVKVISPIPSNPEPEPTPPDPSDNAVGEGVTTGNVNFRTGPSTDYDRIKTLYKGTEIILYRLVNGWYEADAGGDRGYVSGRYVRVTSSNPGQGEEDQPPEEDMLGPGETTARVNFREGPSTSDKKIALLPRGTSVTLISLNNGWYKARYNGKTGHLYAQYVKLTGDSGAPDDGEAGKKPDLAEGVSTGRVNLRTGPSTADGEIIELLPSGTSFKVLGMWNEWYFILWEGKTGYVNKAYARVTEAGSAPIAALDKSWAAYETKTTARVNMRQAPNTSSPIFRLLDRGESVEALVIVDGWTLIRYNNELGYCINDYIGLK